MRRGSGVGFHKRLRRVGFFNDVPAGTPTPSTVLGSALHVWFCAATSDVQLSGDTVTRWTNRAGTGDALDDLYEVAPVTFSANGFNGHPCIVGDGTQRLHATIAELPAGSRPYVWCVYASDASELASSLLHFNVLGFSRANASNTAMGIRVIASGVARTHGALAFADAFVGQSVSESINSGVAEDTGPHLAEYGALATTTGKYTLDGAAFNGSETGVTEPALNSVNVFSSGSPLTSPGTTTLLAGKIAEIVISSSLPTAAQVSQMRSYFRSRDLGLSI